MLSITPQLYTWCLSVASMLTSAFGEHGEHSRSTSVFMGPGKASCLQPLVEANGIAICARYGWLIQGPGSKNTQCPTELWCESITSSGLGSRCSEEDSAVPSVSSTPCHLEV